MNDELFAQVKRKLNITWDDEDTNNRLEDIINSAISFLLNRLGIADPAFDFSAAGDENTLFKNYCLYEYNHILSEFFVNYAELLDSTRARHEVAYFIMSEAGADE